jgi:peptidoglycan/xylan/chitin deacetylase (PgdA/CDA1 family)
MKNQLVKITKFLRFVSRIISSGCYSLGLIKLGTVVLCYHGFSKNNENRYTVDPLEFEKQIVKINKYSKFVNIDHLFEDGGKKHRSSVLITIDDGYKDIFNIIPIIKKYKIPVVLFVLSDPKHAERSELDHNGELLSFGDIKHLHSLGFTIGCHSATHADFKSLNKKQLEHEIINAKKTLEEKLGFTIDYFAYPKGVVNKQIIGAVKKAGYKCAFAVLPGCVTPSSNRWILPRTIIDTTYKSSDFPAVYSPTAFFIRNMLNRFRTLL